MSVRGGGEEGGVDRDVPPFSHGPLRTYLPRELFVRDLLRFPTASESLRPFGRRSSAPRTGPTGRSRSPRSIPGSSRNPGPRNPPAPSPPRRCRRLVPVTSRIAWEIACRSCSSGGSVGARKITPPRFRPCAVPGSGTTGSRPSSSAISPGRPTTGAAPRDARARRSRRTRHRWGGPGGSRRADPRRKAPPAAQRRKGPCGFQDRQIPPMPAIPSVTFTSVTIFNRESATYTPRGRRERHAPRSAAPRPSGPTFPGTPRPPLEQQDTLHDRLPESNVPLPEISTHNPNRSEAGDATPPPQGSSSHQQEPRRVPVAHALPHHHVHPDTATSSRTSTTWSSRRFTSSMYSTFPFAFPAPPSRTSCSPPGSPPPGPGSHHTVLRRVQREVHHLHRRDSYRNVSPTTHGRGTRRTAASHGHSRNGTRYHVLRREDRGERAYRGRLSRPFSPRRRTPPIDGSTAFTRRPFFRSSWPTNALKGKERITVSLFPMGGDRGRCRGPSGRPARVRRPGGSHLRYPLFQWR